MTRKTSMIGVASLVAAAAALGVMASACGKSPGDEESSAAAVASPPAGVAESKGIDVGDGSTADATLFEDGHIRVEIRGANDRFTAEFRKSGVGKVTVAYDYHSPLLAPQADASRTDESDPDASQADQSAQDESPSMELDLAEVPSLDDAVAASVLIKTQLSNAVLGLYDRWGCDLLPGRFSKIVSCGPKGWCCDVHDACYKKYHCSSSSWLRPWTKCFRKCNAPAIACFLAPWNPGRSACCRLGNCGRPR